jgi:hypothetical protein
MVLTYCSDCHTDVIIDTSNLPKYPPHKIVCNECYEQKYNPQVILQKAREEKINLLLKETKIQKITKWFKTFMMK